jgi:hypothetical protein
MLQSPVNTRDLKGIRVLQPTRCLRSPLAYSKHPPVSNPRFLPRVAVSANLRVDLLPQTPLLVLKFRRKSFAEISRLKKGPNFDFRITGHRIRAAAYPFDCFVHRLDLPDPVPGDQSAKLAAMPPASCVTQASDISSTTHRLMRQRIGAELHAAANASSPSVRAILFLLSLHGNSLSVASDIHACILRPFVDRDPSHFPVQANRTPSISASSWAS